MKTAVIIAEYNPFHFGHEWQIRELRRELGRDCAVIAIMSGSMTQRGEPGILDKWSRARMAMTCGVNLVIELPFTYAAASAERFAAGGVQLAEATGLNSHLVFGSESGSLPALQKLADLLSEETQAFREHLRIGLDEGDSFPAARQKAVAAVTGDPALAAMLESSNNILAVEYLKAMKRSDCRRLTPMTIQRVGQAYNDGSLPEPGIFASASAIRRRLANFKSVSGKIDAGLVNDLSGMMPLPALAVLMEKIQSGPGPLLLEDLAVPVISALRSTAPELLDDIPGMAEGLGRRLAAASRRPSCDPDMEHGRLQILLEDAATRRFPGTRIQRALISLLSGITPTDLALFDSAGGPQYLRILGFDKSGRHLLKLMRKYARLPIFMNASDSLESKNPALIRMAELDSLAVDLWMLAAGQACGQDFDRPPVMM